MRVCGKVGAGTILLVEIGLSGGGVDVEHRGLQYRPGSLIDRVRIARLDPDVDDDGLGGMLLEEILHPTEDLLEVQELVIAIQGHVGAARAGTMADIDALAIVIP